MEEPAEAIAAFDLTGSLGTASRWFRRLERESAVEPLAVVMSRVDAEHVCEVEAADD